MADEYTYDVSEPVGIVRLLLNDIPEADEDGEVAGLTAVFTDAEIAAFLTLESGSVKRAAAQAIDTNATNEALASKVLKDHDLTTDGAKLADAMRKHASELRKQVDAADDDAGFYFGVVDIVGGHGRPEHSNYPSY